MKHVIVAAFAAVMMMGTVEAFAKQKTYSSCGDAGYLCRDDGHDWCFSKHGLTKKMSKCTKTVIRPQCNQVENGCKATAGTTCGHYASGNVKIGKVIVDYSISSTSFSVNSYEIVCR